MIGKVNSQSLIALGQLSQKSDHEIGRNDNVKDRVSIIKEQIKNGTYDVDMEKMTKAVVENLI